jgi:hypothetical protein
MLSRKKSGPRHDEAGFLPDSPLANILKSPSWRPAHARILPAVSVVAEPEKQPDSSMFNARRPRPAVASWAPAAAVFLLVLAASATTASAAGTVISTGFESPYIVGPLEGQLDWVAAGSGSSSATVQNTVKHSGTQAVQVVRSAHSDRRWAVQHSGLPTTSLVVIDWDMRVSQTPNSSSFGPFFGIEAYDDAGQPIGLLGSLGVDATTGDVLYQAQDTGILTEANRNIVFNQWHHYRLLLDFATDTYSTYFDGNFLVSQGFVDRGLNLNDFTDADISAIAATGDPAGNALASSAVFDNLVIRDGFGDYDVDGDIDAADYTLWRTSYGQSVQYPGNGADGNNNGVVDTADYVVWRKRLVIPDVVGDYDVDGDVDDADYALWRTSFGQTVQFPGNGADGNNNGIVDSADYVVWRKQFGSGQSSGAGTVNLVPEPTSLGLALVTLHAIALSITRRRFRTAI